MNQKDRALEVVKEAKRNEAVDDWYGRWYSDMCVHMEEGPTRNMILGARSMLRFLTEQGMFDADTH